MAKITLETAAELEFLRNLGTHKMRPDTPGRIEDVPRATRLALLLGYAIGMSKRIDWGPAGQVIDRVTVEMEVERLITQLS